MCLCVVIESSGAVQLFVNLDGTDDPPVYNDADFSEDVDEWTIVAGSFSAFIFEWIKLNNKST